MYRLMPAVLLLAALLAGCTDPDGDAPAAPTSAECLEQGMVLDREAPGGPACVEPPFEVRDFEAPDHHCVVTRQADRVHAPDLVGDPWVQGQWWDYSLSVDGTTLGTTRLVYYDDQDLDPDGRAQHYMVGTVTRELALHHALHSDNPMIGRVHRVLYSPHESGEHADMFHFPLCEGSTWTTTFYGEAFTLTARNATLPVPGQGQVPGFVIAGTSAAGGRLELSYAPAAQWFTYIDLTRADGGTVAMNLEARGKGHAGEAFFLRAQQDEVVEVDGATPVPVFQGALVEHPFTREDGAAGPYDTLGVGVTAQLVGSGVATIELIDPAGQVAWEGSLGGADPATIDIMEEVPYQEGEWTVRVHGAAVDPGALVEARMHIASIYDRSGTV